MRREGVCPNDSEGDGARCIHTAAGASRPRKRFVRHVQCINLHKPHMEYGARTESTGSIRKLLEPYLPARIAWIMQLSYADGICNSHCF